MTLKTSKEKEKKKKKKKKKPFPSQCFYKEKKRT
jgi:hypothetical protein